jgi:hypothetical protein
MAKNSITDYDNIAANNTDIQSVDIDEGCAPSGINNAIRELMADLADVNDGTVPLASPDINGGTIDGVTIGGTTAGAGTFTTVTANGLGIGTGSPAAKIDIVHTGNTRMFLSEEATDTSTISAVNTANNAYSDLNVYANNLKLSTNATERMRIDNSGNVGIGTSSPDAKMNIEQSGIGNFDSIILSRTTGNVGDVQSIVWQQNDLSNLKAASISGEVTGASAGALVFNTATGGTLTERMRINSSGNVGIGTSSPSSYEASANNLVVVDSDGVAGITIVGSSAGASAIHFADGVSGSESYRGYIAYSHNGDYMRFASAATEHMRIDSSGNLLVGTTSSEGPSQLSVVQTDTNQAAIACRHTLGAGEPFVRFINSNNTAVIGTIVNSGNTGTAYNTSSDYRLKEDMQPMTGAIERVNALNPVNFAWKVDGSRVDGFLAHEAQAVVPEAVTGTKDAMQDEEYEVTPAVLDEDGNVVTEAVMGTRSVPNYQGIDQSKLVPLLTAALQEAIAKIETLETKVAALESV